MAPWQPWLKSWRRLDKLRQPHTARAPYPLLIAQGKSNRPIAEALGRGGPAVEASRSRILSKLGFTSRLQMATWALDGRLPANKGRT